MGGTRTGHDGVPLQGLQSYPQSSRWVGGPPTRALWLALALASAVAVLFPSLSASYRGVNPSLQMGSLLAVPPAATAEQLGLFDGGIVLAKAADNASELSAPATQQETTAWGFELP